MINPYYYQGDIIAVKNIRFKDNNFIDTRQNGHPIIILNVVKELNDSIYALKISGSYSYKDGLNKYYILKPTKRNGLTKVSYVDLRYVYKLPNKNIPCYYSLNEEQYNEILEKLKEVQCNELDCDKDYEEFRKVVLK